MNEKFKIIDMASLNDLHQIWNDLNLDQYYAVILKTSQKIKIPKIEKFGKIFGNFLDYDNQNHVIFDFIHNENPLHFDGISTKDKTRIPDRIFFFVDETPLTDEGNFKILNCESVLFDLPTDILSILKKHELEYYGYPSLDIPNPEDLELVFSHKIIQEYKQKKILRMQLPSDNSNYTSIEKDYVHCKATNYRTRFNKMSGLESSQIFNHIHSAIKKNDHLLEINFEQGDFLITKNKFTFHGRYGIKNLLKRKLYRFQIIDY